MLQESSRELRVEQYANGSAVLQAKPYADEIERATHHDGNRVAPFHTERLEPAGNSGSITGGLAKGECFAFGGSHPKRIGLLGSVFCESGRKRPTGRFGKTTEQDEFLGGQ